MKNFTKNDNGFTCTHCGKVVLPLGYTSRDHCPYCLYAIHIDNTPGDRANECKGEQEPIGMEISSKKGYVIVYKCKKCGKITRNIMAKDDNFELLLKIQKEHS